jgi:hypothetical protein
MSNPLETLLREAVRAWPQFDAPASAHESETYVSGADMVEWFAGWRARVKAELPPLAPAVDHYAAVAKAFGWRHGGDGDGFIYDSTQYESWKAALSWSGTGGDNDKGTIYATWRECCEAEDIDPYAEAAREHGWRKAKSSEISNGFMHFQHDGDGHQFGDAQTGWQELCEVHDITPFAAYRVAINYQTETGGSTFTTTVIACSERGANIEAGERLRARRAPQGDEDRRG